jgi:hypothetical protein
MVLWIDRVFTHHVDHFLFIPQKQQTSVTAFSQVFHTFFKPLFILHSPYISTASTSPIITMYFYEKE